MTSPVPLPPLAAERLDTVCQFCIVGCGYHVFRWPVGNDGDVSPSGNALGTDFRGQLPSFSTWLSSSMHTVVADHDGQRFNILIVPDESCSVNQGLSSVRGGGLAKTLFASDNISLLELK